MEVNIVRLIEEQPLEKFSRKTNNKLVTKLQENFTDEEQQLFLASFWCYQNYKPEEFVINLDDVWKWLGFAEKIAKRVIEKIVKKMLIINFAPQFGEQILKKMIDYKILLLQSQGQTRKNEDVFHQTVENSNGRGGHNKETILLTIDGFKKLALKSNTKKADKIHNYYIKLERIINQQFQEDTEKLQNQLEEQTEINKKLKKRINRKIKEREKIGKCVYIMKDKHNPTHFKFGKSHNINHRLHSVNCASPKDHILLHKHWYTIFNDTIEVQVLKAFRNYKLYANSELIEIEQMENVENLVKSLLESLKPYEEDLEELEDEEKDPNNQECRSCEKYLPIEDFYKSGNGNHQKQCKKCWKKEYKQKIESNKKTCEECEETHPFKNFFKFEDGNKYMDVCKECFKPNHKQCKDCKKILPNYEFSGTITACKECHNKTRRSKNNYVNCEFCGKSIRTITMAKHQETSICKIAQGKGSKPKHPVLQLNPETKDVIQEFESIEDAGEQMNISPHYIRRVCIGARNQTGGFSWKWKK
jgi:hypothetical protein